MTNIFTWGKNRKVVKIHYSESESEEETHLTWATFFIKCFTNPKEALLYNPYTRALILHIYTCVGNIKTLIEERSMVHQYRNTIKNIIDTKKMVLNIEHGGLGDWLVFTTLPELLFKTYGIETYISKKSLEALRSIGTYNMCFKDNMYVKGVVDTDSKIPLFTFKPFQREKSIFNLLTDARGKDLISQIYTQFNITEAKAVPKICYQPKDIPEYHNVILVDKNFISGKKLGWYYNPETFDAQIKLYENQNSKIHMIDPKAQDLYTYCDMIYSCSHFITTLSGGAALAATLDKPFTVILPENISGGSVDQFIFTHSKGRYIR